MRGWAWVLVGLLAAGRLAAQDDLPPRPDRAPERLPPDPLFPEPAPRPDREPGSWPQVPGADRDDLRAPRYRVWWYPERASQGRGPTPAADLGYVLQDVNVPFPIIVEPTDILAGSVQVKNLNFQTNAVLPNTLRPFPRNLWDINVSLAYIHRFDSGVSVGVIPKFGSPSDRPFSNFQTLNAGVIGFVRLPAAYEGDFWNLGVIYSPNGQIPFPIPGLAYEYNPNPDVRLSLGIPFSVMWRFADDWRFDFSYRPVTLIHSQVTFEPRPGFQLYGGFDWDNEGYFLVNRPERRDRFFRQEKRLFTGVRVDLAERVSLDLSGGFAFDRNFGSGRNALNYTYDRVDVRSGGFLSAWLLIPF